MKSHSEVKQQCLPPQVYRGAQQLLRCLKNKKKKVFGHHTICIQEVFLRQRHWEQQTISLGRQNKTSNISWSIYCRENSAEMKRVISPKEYCCMQVDETKKKFSHVVFSQVLTASSFHYILFPSALLLLNSY